MSSNNTTESPETGTKQKILDVAIDLFAQKGFDAVSMQDIAQTVGIKKASLYYHFTNKNEILVKILEYPLARVSDVSPKGMEPKELITSMGVDGFLTMSSGLFISWLEDPKIQKVWRIVCIELYHNQEIKRFFSDFIEVSAKFWESNFKIMAERKLIKDLDPKILVNEYLSYFMEAYLHYFLFSYGATKNSFQKEYKELFDQHTKFIIDSIKQQKKGGYQ